VATEDELAGIRDRLFGLVSEDQIRQVTFARPDPAIVASFQAIEDVSSMISDAMDHLGIGARVGASELRPLTKGQRICGPAITIRYTQHGGDVSGLRQRGERSRLGERDMYAAGRAGDVAVFDCGGVTVGSVMGSISARWARRLEIAGCVVDGAVRDVEGIEAEAVQVWSRGVTPTSGNHRMSAVEVNATVAIAGMVVRPGDLIVADGTGVCVVPIEHVSAVAAEVAQIQAGEQSVIDAIEAGVAPRDLPAYTI
jgi:4-hydroxy-4-methyl-2-oxoglutarate aldolase